MTTLKTKISFLLCCVFTLFVLVNTSALAVTPEQIEQAVEKGIVWLVTQQNPNGSWVSWVVGEDFQSSVSATAFAVLKLEEYSRELGYSSPFDPMYPYAQAVDKGLKYIFQNAQIINISPQPAGDPDGDGDGLGVRFIDPLLTPPEMEPITTYDTGIVMMAIAASRSPNRIVVAPGSAVHGWTYKQVLDDAVDYMAFGQSDTSPGRGGWGYYENNNEDTDNSNTGFAVLGLAYAESQVYGFSCIIPRFVRDELNIWVNYIQTDGGPNDGGSGYNGPNDWVNALKTGNLVFEMAFCGDGPASPRMQRALGYIARIWNHPTDNPGWKGPPPHYQAMYCLMKGLEYSGIDEIPVYPIAQRVLYDVDMFEVTGLGSGPVDVEVVLAPDLAILLGFFDGSGNLVNWFKLENGGTFHLYDIAPESGVLRLGVTGEEDQTFEGNDLEEIGGYRITIWPSGTSAPSGPQVNESELNDRFSQRNVFSSTGQLIINGELSGISQYFPPEGTPVLIDWYDDLANVIVATQQSDGSWPADREGSGDSVLTTAWAMLILEKIAPPPPPQNFGQWVYQSNPFRQMNLGEYWPEGTPPLKWTHDPAQHVILTIGSGNVLTIDYDHQWYGEETVLFHVTDNRGYSYDVYGTFTVIGVPIVGDIPDQTTPFEPFDLDDYLLQMEPEDVEWTHSEPPPGWTVEIDADNVVTVTAPADATGSATIEFTATNAICPAWWLALGNVPPSSVPEKVTFMLKKPMKSFLIEKAEITWASNTFVISGNFELPKGYQKTDLDRSAVLSIQIASTEAKDTVAFMDLGQAWAFMNSGFDGSLSQGMKIQKFDISWSNLKGSFYIKGGLSLAGVGPDTVPREAMVALELGGKPPVIGKAMVGFERQGNVWYYGANPTTVKPATDDATGKQLGSDAEPPTDSAGDGSVSESTDEWDAWLDELFYFEYLAPSGDPWLDEPLYFEDGGMQDFWLGEHPDSQGTVDSEDIWLDTLLNEDPAMLDDPWLDKLLRLWP